MAFHNSHRSGFFSSNAEPVDVVISSPHSPDFDVNLPSPNDDTAQVGRRKHVFVPLRLAPRPAELPTVNLEKLVLDSDLEDVPVRFIVDTLISMGPHLLQCAKSTRLLAPENSHLHAHVECEAPLPPYSLHEPPSGISKVLLPTHVLQIASVDSPSQHLLMPVHGLLWAMHCAALARISSTSQLPSNLVPSSEDATFFLPIVTIRIPSARGFLILHEWIHLLDHEKLLASLLPRLSTTTPLNLLPTDVLLQSISTVRGLWLDAVSLQVNDRGLWETMEDAWDLLVEALGTGQD